MRLCLDGDTVVHAAQRPRQPARAAVRLTRALRLVLLAPDIVEATLDGQQGPEVTLARVLKPVPHEWMLQTENDSSD